MWKLIKTLPKSWHPSVYNCLGSNAPCKEATFQGSDDVTTNDNKQGSSEVTCQILAAKNLNPDGKFGIGCRYTDQVLRWGKRISSHENFRLPYWNSPSIFEALGIGFAILVGLRYGCHPQKNDEKPRECQKSCPISTLFKVAYAIHGPTLRQSILSQDAESLSYEAKGETLKLDENASVATTSLELNSESNTANLPEAKPPPSVDSILSRMQALACEYSSHILNLEAQECLKQNKLKQAIKRFQEAGDLGLDVALFNLGTCYETGVGVDKDLNVALQFYKKAAKLGHTTSLYNMAIFYLEGKGVPVDENLGIKCMEKASDGGVKEAQTYMGLHYGENEHFEVAVCLFEKAVQQKHPDAEYMLGICYENGLGVEENIAKAAELFARAASADNVEAYYKLATYYEQGFGGLPTDKAYALELYQKAAVAGHSLAMKRLEWGYLEDSEDEIAEENFILKPDMSPKSNLREVSSSPDLSTQELVRDVQLSKRTSSSSVFDFSNLKEFISDYLNHEEKPAINKFYVGDPEECDQPNMESPFKLQKPVMISSNFDASVKAW